MIIYWVNEQLDEFKVMAANSLATKTASAA
jgi:hypothetical protein